MIAKSVRLVVVEVRRATDTPGPRWAIASCVLAGFALALLQPGGVPRTFADFVNGATIALPLLVALLSVMAFTADWTTRAALVTFAVNPRRHEVIIARTLATMLLTVGSVLALHVLAALAYVIAQPSSTSTVFEPQVATQLWSMTAITLAITLTTVSVAGLVLRTSLALVIAVLAPLAVTIGLAFLPGVIDWLGPYSFSNWLADPTVRLRLPDGVGLAPATTSFLLWTAAPLVGSWLRQMRAEPR